MIIVNYDALFVCLYVDRNWNFDGSGTWNLVAVIYFSAPLSLLGREEEEPGEATEKLEVPLDKLSKSAKRVKKPRASSDFGEDDAFTQLATVGLVLLVCLACFGEFPRSLVKSVDFAVALSVRRSANPQRH